MAGKTKKATAVHTRPERSRPVGRQAGHFRRDAGSVQRHGYPPLGAGDGLSQPDPLEGGVCQGFQVRRHRRAAVLHRGDGLRPRLPPHLRRQDSGLAPDLRRRGVVVVRHSHSPRRQSVPATPLRRLHRRPRPSSPARRCSRAATPCIATSTVRWWPRSARPRSAT